jgi:hypothetical protein
MTIPVIDANGTTVTILTPNELSANIVAAIGAATYYPATQPVSGTVAVTGVATETTLASLLTATQNLAPLSSIVAVTPGATAFTVSRAIIASEDMTANLTVGGVDVDGVILNRGINPIAATKVRAVSVGSVFRAN